MKKLAHVSVQTWKGWRLNDLHWVLVLSILGGFKTLTGATLLVLGGCLLLPCLISFVLQSFRAPL
jgi:hypothetical protein